MGIGTGIDHGCVVYGPACSLRHTFARLLGICLSQGNTARVVRLVRPPSPGSPSPMQMHPDPLIPATCDLRPLCHALLMPAPDTPRHDDTAPA
jgi:hypothetical protein